MKQRLFLLACALSISAISICSCFQKQLILPQNLRFELSAEEAPSIHYTDASIFGTVSFSGSTEGYVQNIEQSTSVKVQWGTDKNNLPNTCFAVLNDATERYSILVIPFKADLKGLEDGAVYYYQVFAKCGNLELKQTDVLKFFTLPEGPVNLDLKSGNLWHSHNLRAQFPDESGDYISWGELEPKKANAQYDWSNYKWCNGDSRKMTKYCTNEYYGYNGFVDNLTRLEDEDDAAIMKLGNGWHMPTSMDWIELNEQCGWTKGSYNGVSGWFIRSKANPDDNKKVIFVPLSGYYNRTNKNDDNYQGCYWTSEWDGSLFTGEYANYFSLHNYDSHVISQGSRCCGLSIRPVRSK